MFIKFYPLRGRIILLPTLLLLIGNQGMYQKFFSARSERDARLAVFGWIAEARIPARSLSHKGPPGGFRLSPGPSESLSRLGDDPIMEISIHSPRPPPTTLTRDIIIVYEAAPHPFGRAHPKSTEPHCRAWKAPALGVCAASDSKSDPSSGVSRHARSLPQTARFDLGCRRLVYGRGLQTVRQFEIWWANLPAPAGRRPVLLLSRHDAYQYLSKFIVAEIT